MMHHASTSLQVNHTSELRCRSGHNLQSVGKAQLFARESKDTVLTAVPGFSMPCTYLSFCHSSSMDHAFIREA